MTFLGIVLTTVFETKLYDRSDSLLFFFGRARAWSGAAQLVDLSQGRLQLRVARENVFSDRLLNDEFQDFHYSKRSRSRDILQLFNTFYHFFALLASFWALSAAATVGFINCTASIGGFVGPKIIGNLSQATGSFRGGFLFMIACWTIASLLVLLCPRENAAKRVNA